MNEFHEPHAIGPAGRDPLERLVEAFVELSVPEGPDAAIERRLLASLTAGPIELAPQSLRAAPAPSWIRTFGRQALALAAGILVMAATALLVMSGRGRAPNPVSPDAGQMAGDGAQSPADSLQGDVETLLNQFLRTDLEPSAPRPDLIALINAILKERSQLSKSDGWRRAQERVAVALEQPEVIGVGVGLLGTLPWATHGRF